MPDGIHVVIQATRTHDIASEKGRRVRELTAKIEERFHKTLGNVQVFLARVPVRGLCAAVQAESLRYKLLGGMQVRRASYSIMRFIMQSGAQGCEVIVSGKLRGQRAKTLKVRDGMMVKAGQPVTDFVDSSTKQVTLRQGSLGLKVKIMLPTDKEGKVGPCYIFPDHITILEPSDEDNNAHKKKDQGLLPRTLKPVKS
ncbi:small ribosomal subunit protein uS3-like isoform X2 [Oratosquilla oratoria]